MVAPVLLFRPPILPASRPWCLLAGVGNIRWTIRLLLTGPTLTLSARTVPETGPSTEWLYGETARTWVLVMVIVVTRRTGAGSLQQLIAIPLRTVGPVWFVWTEVSLRTRRPISVPTPLLQGPAASSTTKPLPPQDSTGGKHEPPKPPSPDKGVDGSVSYGSGNAGGSV